MPGGEDKHHCCHFKEEESQMETGVVNGGQKSGSGLRVHFLTCPSRHRGHHRDKHLGFRRGQEAMRQRAFTGDGGGCGLGPDWAVEGASRKRVWGSTAQKPLI